MTPGAFFECVTSIARLHDLRTAASRRLSDAGIDRVSVDKVLLVLSETCTNAFTHGRAEAVDVEIAIDESDDGDGATIIISMSHDDHDPAQLVLPAKMPPPDATFGRGLALVDRLVDGMTVWIDPPRIVRRCWLRADATASG